MPKNRPTCPVCAGKTTKHGTTAAHKTRWRCTTPTCGATTTKPRTDLTQKADFTAFHTHVTGLKTLTDLAKERELSTRTLQRRFAPFWLIPVPTNPDPGRIYDQIFIDGTYTHAGCLLVAYSHDHVINWVWAKTENTAAYTRLLEPITAPLCVVLDGGQGAASAIKQLWPTTAVQRCLVHAQRVIRRHTTSRPRTRAGKAIYTLALALTTITTLDEAHQWTVNLHNFGQVYRDYLNEKTITPTSATTSTWQYTHLRVRKAYNSLVNLVRKKVLFTYLQPPAYALTPHRWDSTTNRLEGAINSQIKELAHRHRGRAGERQRTMIDWWLHSKTQLPADPLEIARQCAFGQDLLAKVTNLAAKDSNASDPETGRPAIYDNAIPTEYNHNLGIRQGNVG